MGKMATRPCIRCGKPVLQPAWKAKSDRPKKTCSVKCCYERRGTPEERFRKGFEKRGPDECWLWNKVPNEWGYGQFRRGGVQGGKMEYAHRISWEFHRGPIPKGMHALHTCDVRLCVNPNHLYLGTNQDNINDKMRRGRAKSRRLKPGEKEAVVALLKVNVARVKIVELLGVCPKTVHRHAKRLSHEDSQDGT